MAEAAANGHTEVVQLFIHSELRLVDAQELMTMS